MIRLLLVFISFYSGVLLAQLSPLALSPKAPSKFVTDNQNSAHIKPILLTNEKLRSPQATMRTFIGAMEKIKSGDRSAWPIAIETLNLSQIDPTLRESTGKLTAERLIGTLDRIVKINLSKIPSYQNGVKWILRKQSAVLENNLAEVEISIDKMEDGNWRFTNETVATIENFYESVSHLKVLEGNREYRNWRTRIKERMPDWTGEEFLMFKKGQWIGFFGLFVLSLACFGVVRLIIALFLRLKVQDKTLSLAADQQFSSTLPFGCLAFSVTWLLGIRLLELEIEALEILSRISYIFTAFFSVWSSLKLVDYISLRFEKIAELSVNKFDNVLVPMLKTTSKVIVVSFGVLLIAHSLTFDVASILAGLGIGGVAIALAAKDTISNLFGSVTVLIDRPFQIGDYVILGKEIEGSIEAVGFRSTRIRTPVNSLVTLPNSVLANMAIDNYGMRKMRRFKTTLQVEYATSRDLIQEFCERLRYLIQLNPLIDHENFTVSVFELGASSIDIQLTLFFVTNQQNVELAERHNFILEILKTGEELGIKFAYPTQTVLLENSATKLN